MLSWIRLNHQLLHWFKIDHESLQAGSYTSGYCSLLDTPATAATAVAASAATTTPTAAVAAALRYAHILATTPNCSGITLSQTEFFGNKAIGGGGGAIFWDGPVADLVVTCSDVEDGFGKADLVLAGQKWYVSWGWCVEKQYGSYLFCAVCSPNPYRNTLVIRVSAHSSINPALTISMRNVGISTRMSFTDCNSQLGGCCSQIPLLSYFFCLLQFSCFVFSSRQCIVYTPATSFLVSILPPT